MIDCLPVELVKFMRKLFERRIYGNYTAAHQVGSRADPQSIQCQSGRMDMQSRPNCSDAFWIQQSSSVHRQSRHYAMPKAKDHSKMSSVLAKFQQITDDAQKASSEDVFSSNWKAPKLDRNDPNYGRPKPGSLTEKRGIAAGNHISREIVQLCELINEFGDHDNDDTVTITFGKLFDIYVYVSDKVVGMLLRARRHKIVDFKGEMLYQRQDENVLITMLLPIERVRMLYTQSQDPATCLKIK